MSNEPDKPLQEGESCQPFVPASENPLEFTLKSVAAGIFFGILFGAANAYLGLYAGLTISTSIPVAVMTVAAFKTLSIMGRKTTILEANISQTIGSASSSLASGVIFTLPALFLWGLDPSLMQMTFLAMCGGLIGVLFMVPLRQFLIAREHGNLPYPEGTACAEVLVASEVGGNRARNIFLGLGIGMFFKALTSWAKLLPGKVAFAIPFLPKSQIAAKLSGALVGVGYILGPRIATIMVGGGLLSWLVILPAMALWGESRVTPLYPETALLIPDMDPMLMWNRYVRYIGAGAVATAGIITLVKSIPTMIASFKIGVAQLKERVSGAGTGPLRTGLDLPLKYVAIGVGVIAVFMALVPYVFGPITSFPVRLFAAVLVVVFAFFFVTVSSRIVGLVGVTSNPTSGMTIATLLATSSVFLLLGWTGDVGKVAAITVGCVVAIAASIAGDTSQDLKTGFLLGATPRKQQTGELIGVLTSAVFVCLAVILLGEAYEFGSEELAAPQATLMKLVVEGIFDNALPWGLVFIGVGISIVIELLKIPSLPFAVGVYLPLSTTFSVFLGGMLRKFMESRAANEDEKASRREKGILFGSGLVGGEGLLGVAIAAAVFIQGKAPEGFDVNYGAIMEFALGITGIALLLYLFARSCLQRDNP